MANDRNDCSIRVAVNWNNKHLQQVIKGHEAPPPTVVLITNNRYNRQKVTEMGIEAYTIHDYAKSLTGHPTLVDRLARSSKESESEVTTSKGKILFPEHLPLSMIQTNLKSENYLQGGSRENYLEGFVNVASLEKFVLIQGLQHLNRAVQGRSWGGGAQGARAPPFVICHSGRGYLTIYYNYMH